MSIYHWDWNGFKIVDVDDDDDDDDGTINNKPKVYFDYGWNLSWDSIILCMLTHHISLRLILTLPKSHSIFLMTFSTWNF